MGFSDKTSAQYWNVSRGAIRQKDVSHGGYTGIIDGIRTKLTEFEGQEQLQLQIRMADPDTGESIIISGTMFYGRGMMTVTTWARMLLARLVNKENNLGPGDILDISFYTPGDSEKVTCVAVRRLGEDKALQGVDFKKDNPTRCKQICEEAIKVLIERYGVIETKTQEKPHDFMGEPPAQEEDDGLPF